nr:MAG TPA: hypothetical protein [Caudoviricetes sp.]
MAAIAYTVTKIADMAESIGYRVWFDFATCYIHKMRGAEVARFEMDDGRNLRIGANFASNMNSAYGKDFLDLVSVLCDAGSAQSRKGLYVVFDKSFGWWNVRELPDGSGANNVGANSFDAMYTKRGADRIKARYDVARTCEVRAVEQDNNQKTGDNDGVQSGQNNPSGGNNNFFRMNF